MSRFEIVLTFNDETEFGAAMASYIRKTGAKRSVAARDLLIRGLKNAGELPEWWDGIRYK